MLLESAAGNDKGRCGATFHKNRSITETTDVSKEEDIQQRVYFHRQKRELDSVVEIMHLKKRF